MTKQNEMVNNFIGDFFGPNSEKYGRFVDEIIHFYVDNEKVENINGIISAIDHYLSLYRAFPEKSDDYFRENLKCSYNYKDDYLNSVEFLKNVVGKIIIYRDKKNASK